MNIEELKQIIREVLNENRPSAKAPIKKAASARRAPAKKSLEFSKKLMVFASVMYAATWLVAVISWFRMQAVPERLLEYATYLYGVALVVYGGKSAYENKPKIEASYNYNGQDGAC